MTKTVFIIPRDVLFEIQSESLRSLTRENVETVIAKSEMLQTIMAGSKTADVQWEDPS